MKPTVEEGADPSWLDIEDSDSSDIFELPIRKSFGNDLYAPKQNEEHRWYCKEDEGLLYAIKMAINKQYPDARISSLSAF